MPLDNKYDPQSFETDIYQKWEKSGYFKPSANPQGPPYCIVIPPPNITGQLHMGHALNDTIQDIIIRQKRMQGYSTLWVPGTDHASIATEVKIVEQLAKEGTTKEEIGRDKFLEKAYLWKETYGGTIVKQLRELGASCDWSREAFTMDERCSKAVREVFVNLYDKGLIYQGNKVINWCPSCLTALSDAEVEYEEDASNLWHIRYPYSDGSGYLIIATTRPETLLGDAAVAVNPQDARYKDVVGKTLNLPLTDKQIPIIADNYVEIEFGTGAVKITPAHDPNDFEVGLRHDLPVVKVIDDAGKMNELAYAYKGLDRYAARKKVVEDLQALGLIEKIEKYNHNVGRCYRCHTTIEQTVSKQWFVKMDGLAKPAIDVVKNKKVVFIPNRFSKIYFNWMENVKDWCISRQLWWGHRIPAWYCKDCGEIIVSVDTPTKCTKCNSTNIYQDEDVLDTWFSSALWPFSTLGFPEMTKDLKRYYPTNLLVTAYDIIFFWVARMIFSGIEHMGEIPFPEVLIHGIVRDAFGKKMSKSAGNGIDPLKLIDKYGADTLRFSLCVGVAPGSDVRFSEKKVEPARNFMNKIWNASKFVLKNLENVELLEMGNFSYSTADKWILHKLNNVNREVTKNMKKYDLGLAANKLYDFIWSDFCDWFVELTKPALYGDVLMAKRRELTVLVFVLRNILKLMHPFTPFITERIWQEIGDTETIMYAEFPKYAKKHVYTKEYERFENIKDMIVAIRNIRAEKNVSPSKPLDMYVCSEMAQYVLNNKTYINKLANINEIMVIDSPNEIQEKTINMIVGNIQFFVPLGELVNIDEEINKITNEMAVLDKEIARGEGMLKNQGFISKAPPQLVETEKTKLEANKTKKMLLEQRILELKS